MTRRIAGPGQVSLFADEEAERAAQEAAELEAWRGTFTRRDFPAPYDCAGDTKKGDIISGWVCPDCGQVEWNTYLLSLNHGYDPDQVGHRPYREGSCTRMQLLASQEASRLAREAKGAPAGS